MNLTPQTGPSPKPILLARALPAVADVFVAAPPSLWWDEPIPFMAQREKIVQFWEGLWNAMLERLRTPVTGILLSRDLARKVGEPILARLVRRQGDDSAEAETTAEGLKEATLSSKEYVADERKLSGDQERHRDPDDQRYNKNLCLPDLQDQDKNGRFNNREWESLDRFLRPFGFQILKRKGMAGEDSEDIFNETIASLAVVKENHPQAPIEELIVFEEIIPNFCKLIGWRAIDSVRRRTTQKARPESLQSLDAMQSEDAAPVQVADPSTADRERPDTWRFEEIYAQCQEDLTALEWGLLHDLYVAQRYTVKDLIADEEKLTFLGIDSSQSASTLRRRVEEIINPALEKLADALSV